MSHRFVQRLRSVREEFEASREAIAYVKLNWYRYNIYDHVMDGLEFKHLANAAESLEAVFIIRLFTTFEGILKEHLARNHPRIRVEEDARAIRLVDRVALLQNPHISTQLRNKVHAVRRYRNFLVHSGGTVVNRIFFDDALAPLSTYAARLPDPPK